MDKLFKKLREFLYSKSTLVFLIVMIVIFPMSIMKKASAFNEVVVLSMGVTKEGELYTIFTQTIKPENEAKIDENIEVNSASGSTFKESVKKLTKELGKNISFENLQVVVFNVSMENEKKLEIIKQLVLEDTPLFCELLATEDDVENIIKESNELNDSGTKSLRSYAEFLDKGESEKLSVNILRLLNDENVKLPKI